MNNHNDKIITLVLGLIVCGVIAWTFGPVFYAFISNIREINKWESKMNYRYVYAIPETSLFMQTYFYNNSLYTFIGNDTIIDNGSHFSVRYFSDLTLVLLDVVNDSLVYLVDHNNDVDSINNKSVMIEYISNGFDNSNFYIKQYTDDSRIYYAPKFPQKARISIYSGKVRANGVVVPPMIIKRETVAIPQ